MFYYRTTSEMIEHLSPLENIMNENSVTTTENVHKIIDNFMNEERRNN